MSDATATRNLTLDSRDEAVILFGPRDQFLRTVRDALGVKVVARGDLLQIEGSPEAAGQAERAFQQLRQLLRKHGKLTAEDVRTVIEVVRGGSDRGGGSVTTMESGRGLRARTDGQGRYVQALKSHDVVICVGPAGSGKTYLAVGWAVGLLRSGAVKKIVLVRPAVEAGERLGYLPGDLVAKISPYLRPLFDALAEIMDAETVKKYMENDIIEILPLAYMRGRTLNNSVIILDEGQNATAAQMKMFLTRMGLNSKIVVTGDMTQTDLPKTVRSGLADAVQRLKDVEGLSIIYLDQADIVRNPLVTRIVKAYEDEGGRPRRTGG
ncbi:MAG TPA: PhoH family protein [Gemmata sp.]|jgi:phosphate starvation-inducible PhoH-like protein|nr:PhoH family protein [Gemmata sp.]